MSKERRLSSRLAALWLVPMAMVFALLLGEGLFRLFPNLLPEEAQIRRLWQRQTEVKSVGDPYLGFVYPPYYKTEIKTLDFRFDIESDEHGFRNPSPWPEQADIVIVGDSLAYGWGVEWDAAWPKLIGDELPQHRVITLGLPGTVPQQYFRYFEKFGVGLRPKILIFAIFPGNDIVEAKIFDRWVAAGSPGNYNEWRFFEGKVPSRQATLLENSHLLLFLRSLRKSLGQQYESKTVQTADGGKVQLSPGLYLNTLRSNNPADSGFSSIVRATVAARNLARASGSEFLVMLFPTKEAVYLPSHGVNFPSLVRPLRDVLEREGIACLDLTGKFLELGARGERIYFEIDGHPNERGNRVIADALEEYLEQNAAHLGLETGKSP